MRVAADTPTGVVFREFTTAGKGSLIVVERFAEKIAEAEHCQSDEVEVIYVQDVSSGQMLWMLP